MGRLVYSKSGRDRGRAFIVVKVVNDRYVIVADGDLRKIENPKMKNSKHLQFTKYKVEKVISCLAEGKYPENHVIRKEIKQILETIESTGKEV